MYLFLKIFNANENNFSNLKNIFLPLFYFFRFNNFGCLVIGCFYFTDYMARLIIAAYYVAVIKCDKLI